MFPGAKILFFLIYCSSKDKKIRNLSNKQGYYEKNPYICGVHFDKPKTKANNNMSGRFAQNLSKSYQKSICQEGCIDEAIKRFYNDYVGF